MPRTVAYLLVLLCFGTCSSSRGEKTAPETPPLISLRLSSGRVFAGHIDPRSDDQQLRLRCIYGNAVVLRSIQWERIESITLNGETLPVEEFRTRAQDLKRATPLELWPQHDNDSTKPTPQLVWSLNWRPPLCLSKICSLDAAVHGSNWNADACADGFTLRIAPVDHVGTLVPAEGVIEATLFGYDRRNGLPLEHWSPLARWSRSITLSCYGPEGGLLRLPFDEVAADLRAFRSPRHMLRVRLTAPAHGTFAAEIPFMVPSSSGPWR